MLAGLASLSDPLSEPEFQTGLVIGSIALAVGLAVCALWRRRTDRPAPIGGLLLAGAALVAVERADATVAEVVGPLVVLAAIGLGADLWPLPAPVLAVLALPGAWWLAAESSTRPETWIEPLLVVVVAVGGAGLASFDRAHRRSAIGLPMVLITVAGAYSTLPDTEQALAVLGVSVPIALAGWPLRLLAIGHAGALATAGALAFTVAQGGVGRPRAMVAGAGCVGLLVVEPIARWLTGRSKGRRPIAASLLILLTGHLLVVAFVARVAGLRSTTAEVALLTVGALLVALLATVVSMALSAPPEQAATEQPQPVQGGL